MDEISGVGFLMKSIMPKNQIPKRSSIWIYFNEQSRDVGKCSICGAIISTRGGSTSNLRRHIKAKHKKIALDKLDTLHMNKIKSSAKAKQLPEPEQKEVEEEDEVERSETEECSGEKFHSEVVFHDYTATEQVEVTVDEDGNTQPTVIVEERRAPMKKPNILQRHVTTSSVRNNNNEVIRKISNEYVLSDKSIRKAEALEQIAYNLGRLATVFEKMSGLIGLINQHEQQEQHESEEQASEDVGVKVDGLIMNILSDDNF